MVDCNNHLTMITVRYRNQLKLGNVSDHDFPTFCYQGEFCNPDNLQMGLFRGTFLMQVRNTISSEQRQAFIQFVQVLLSDLHRASIGLE